MKNKSVQIITWLSKHLILMFWLFITAAIVCGFGTIVDLLTHENIPFDNSGIDRFYEVLLLLTLILFFAALVCYVIQFFLTLKSNKEITIGKKFFSCCFLYFSTSVIFTLSVSFVDILISYTVKADEFLHYGMIIAENKDLTPCESTSFLKGRTYSWYLEDTMYQTRNEILNPDFCDTIKKHLEGNPIDRTKLQELIKIDYSNIPNNLSEMFYFSISTISTLGYGDITPTTGLAKLGCAFYVCFGQFITILVVAKILSQKEPSKADPPCESEQK